MKSVLSKSDNAHLTGLITQFLAKCHEQATPFMKCSKHTSAQYHNMRKKTIIGTCILCIGEDKLVNIVLQAR